MSTHPLDVQAVFSFMQDCAVEECAEMNGPEWNSWSSWLLDNPWLLQSVHDGLMQEGFTPVQCEKAISSWLSQSLEGVASVSSGSIDANDTLTWWQMEVLDPGTGEPEARQIQASHRQPMQAATTPTQEPMAALWRIENRLLVCHHEAPVLVAVHHPQVWDDDHTTPFDIDLSASSHLAVESFVSMGPSDREGLMGQDSETSDILKQDAMASQRARQHEGPFYYTASLHRPAAPLIALRTQLSLDAHTAITPSQTRVGPRL